MTLKSLTIFAVLAAGFGLVSEPVMAKGKINTVPVNFPPASFKGKQFVDNRGCVYVRAGFDGAVNWVPRVSRQRTQVCGQKPTFGGAVAASKPAAKPASKPVQITVPAATAAPKPAAKPKPKPVVAARPAPKPKPKPAARVVRQAPKPKPVVRSVRTSPQPKPQATPRRVIRAPASKPVAAQPPRIVRRAPQVAPSAPSSNARRVVVPNFDRCRNGQTTRTVRGVTVDVRCGPQTAPHVTVIRRGEAPGPGKKVYRNQGWQGSSLRGNTRIVPRHVYEKRARQIAHVPAGYRPAWDDDRLNPNRAVQTVDGYMKTQQVWTNTVPRQLVSQSRQHRVKAPVIAYRAAAAQPAISTQGSLRTPVISTRSTPRNAMTDRATSSRFVEIGVFTTEGKAQAAAARLSGAGLPVKFANYTRNGASMRRVMVGPYAASSDLNAAMAAVRSVGYVQAYMR